MMMAPLMDVHDDGKMGFDFLLRLRVTIDVVGLGDVLTGSLFFGLFMEFCI